MFGHGRTRMVNLNPFGTRLMASRRVSTVLQHGLVWLFVGTASISCGGSDGSGGGITRPPANNDPSTPSPAVPTSISVSRSTLQLSSVGDTQTVVAEVRDQAGAVLSAATLRWSSSNTQVATVSANGEVVGSVAVSGPSVRFTRDVLQKFSDAVLEAAAHLTRQFGGEPELLDVRQAFSERST